MNRHHALSFFFALTLAGVGGFARLDAQATPTLHGVYQAVDAATTLPGGLRNAGDPSMIRATAAARRATDAELADDPAKLCQPIGPFRMMATPRVKIELVPGPGIVMMLFEDLSHGYLRPIHLTRPHRTGVEPTRQGDAIGHWEAGTFVIDTVGFNDRAWLNDAGLQHSGALHLVERIRPLQNGRYLEYKITAEDPKALAAPYSYTRYFEKLSTEIEEDLCLFD